MILPTGQTTNKGRAFVQMKLAAESTHRVVSKAARSARTPKRSRAQQRVRVSARFWSACASRRFSPIVRKYRSSASNHRRAAFTMIELILVMALLIIVVSVTFPSLRNFFRGRTLVSEARRFLTLTRYAQSRAASEGIPMTLWIDPIQGSYGLEAQRGFLDQDTKAVTYDVDEKLDIQIAEGGMNRAQLTQEQQMRRRTVSNSRNNANSEIRFAPDGSVDVTSPQSICIREAQNKDHALWIVLAQNRNNYEEQNESPSRTR